MKDVVIIADFCSAFDGKSNNRFIYIAEKLLEKDYQVEIITSDFFHGDKKHFDPTVKEYNGLKVTMLHEPAYTKNISIKRFLAHYKWGKEVGKYLKKRKKPDVVYCAIPTLKAASVAGKYCNKNGIKFIIDIQDLWPEAYKMVLNIPLISNILFLPFKVLADKAYRRADKIIAVSQTYVKRALAVNKKNNNGYAVFLGTDLKTFDKNVEIGRKILKNSGEIWMGYCGTLGSSYNLLIVFDALKRINDSKIKFIIMGDGPKKEEFERTSKGLNVFFTGRLPYQDMCGVLSQCDFVINPIMHNAAQSIINKHADYAAVGLPVINTQENNEYRKLVEQYNMGFNVDNNDIDDLAEKIQILSNDATLRSKMGKNARKCAEELFDRDKTYSIITNLAKDTGGGCY